MSTPHARRGVRALRFAAFNVLVLVCPLAAHDFWIVPATFRPEVGATLAVALRVGEHFRGEPVRRDRTRIERFFALGPTGEKPVVGRHGGEPAGLVRIDAPGLWIVGYRSRPTPISLAAEAFESYLSEEGLERIIELRAARGESRKEGREVFSRSAKALIAAGSGGEGHDRRLGLTLELVPEKNPYALGPGVELPVRLLYQGSPLAGALVVAMNADEPDTRLSARSGPEGRVVFRLGRDGVWLVKAVQMVAAAPESRADWESVWASLTFELPARAR